MSNVPNDTVALLKSILDARDERGFVDLSQIHKLVAPVDQRETVMLLSPKKIADVRARLTTHDFDPVRLENGRVFVFYELAYEVIIHRRADLKQIVLEWRGERGNVIEEIVRSVPELAGRVKEVFGETGIRHARIEGKFYFAAADMAKLVLWDEQTQTPSQSALNIYVKRAAHNDDKLLTALARTYHFR